MHEDHRPSWDQYFMTLAKEVATRTTCLRRAVGAIIVKDRAAGLLAEELNADTLMILTSVEKVSLNHNTDQESYLDTISTEDAKKYIADDQFAAGSMLPKIEAGVSFVEKGTGRRTIITDMAHAKDGYCEKTGTIIK